MAPEPWVAFREAYTTGDHERLSQAQRAIDVLVPILGPSIANLKYGLSVLGQWGGPTRMSIDEPTTEARQAIEAALAEAESLLR